MEIIEEFDIEDARKLSKDIRKNLFYIHIKKDLRQHIMEVSDSNPFTKDFFTYKRDSEDYRYEENDFDIKYNIPEISKLEKMFKLDGFDAKINFERLSHKHKLVDKYETRKPKGSRMIKIHVKDTWS